MSIIPRARPAGSGPDSADWTTATEAATRQKLAWIRQAAGDRFATLELNTMVYAASSPTIATWQPVNSPVASGLTEDEVIASPHILVGSIAADGR